MSAMSPRNGGGRIATSSFITSPLRRMRSISVSVIVLIGGGLIGLGVMLYRLAMWMRGAWRDDMKAMLGEVVNIQESRHQEHSRRVKVVEDRQNAQAESIVSAHRRIDDLYSKTGVRMP